MAFKSFAGLAGPRRASRAALSCAFGALAAALAPAPTAQAQTAQTQPQPAPAQPQPQPTAGPQPGAATPLPPIPVQTKKPRAKIGRPARPRPAPAAPAGAAAAQAEAPTRSGTAAQGAEGAGARGLTAPLSGSTVRGETLAAQRSATSDTASLLQSTPGVSVYTGGGVSNLPVVHGLNDDRVNTTINGMAITAACGNHMNPILSHADPAAVKHIDVMAGVSPVSAGGDSLGSVIAVETAAPEFAGPGQDLVTHARLSTFVRSVNEGVGGSVSGSVATSNSSASYTGSWTRGDNYGDGHGDEVGSTLYEAWNHALSLAARGSSDLLVIDAGIQKIPYQGYVNQWMDMTDNEAWFVNSRYERKFAWGRLHLQAFYQHTDHEMEYLPDKKIGAERQADILTKVAGRPMGMPAMPMLTEGQNMGYKVKADIPVSSIHMLRIGNELHRNTLDDWWPPVIRAYDNQGAPLPNLMCCETFWNVHGGERTRLGTFVEVESKWTRAWTTLFGLRNDLVWMDTGDVQGYYTRFYGKDADAFNARDHAKTDVNFDATALARYEPTSTSAYEFGYTRKTRSPSLYERYVWSANPMAMAMNGWFGDSNGYVGNLDLDPEVAHTASFTAAWRDRARKDWEIKVTPYYTYVEDYIGVEKIADNCPVFRDAAGRCPFLPTGDGTNARLRLINHDAELFGVDIAGSKALWESPDYGRFTLTGALSYTHGENAETGDPLYHIMPLNGRIGLEHRWGHWTNAVELNIVADKDLVDPLRKELPTDGYALVNLRSRYEWGPIRLDFGIENLFNEYYELPLGGVNIGKQPLSLTPITGQNGAITGATYPAGSYPVGNVPGPGRNVFAGVTMTF